jgi:hypothetical protein
MTIHLLHFRLPGLVGPVPAQFTVVLSAFAEVVRRRITSRDVKRASIALIPCILGGIGATLLSPEEWCFGAVRSVWAVCFGGAAASGTLLICWGLYPANLGRSMVYAALGGLAAAAPLLVGF